MKDQEVVEQNTNSTEPLNGGHIQMLCPMDLPHVMGQLKDCDAIKYAAYRYAYHFHKTNNM